MQVSAPHIVPSVSREQVRISVAVVLVLQVPAPQRGVVIVRLCMPLSSQLSAYMPQALHAPGTGAPHVVPSVVRAQPAVSFSMVMRIWQVPAPQVGVVMVRLRDPLSLHVASRYVHALHPPTVGAPQELPSVLRAHGSLSMRASASQVPVEVHA